MQISPPRARTLIHPGPFNPLRIKSKGSIQARHFRLLLTSGVSLYDGLVSPLSRLGVKSASMTILGGQFSELSYCVAPPDPQKRAVIAYTEPMDVGPAYMIFGNATLGKFENGAPIVHCHAAIRTTGGNLKGGHMVTQKCLVGPNSITVLVTSLDDFDLRVCFDAETNISLLQPHEIF
jgi:predicted DNA-binding protein with PD1-like motif